MASATLLLVQDDIEIRTVLVLYLVRRGYRVVEARDGRSGLETFLDQGADVILLDALLPKLDGLGFLRELRAHERGRTVPVIVMSAVRWGMVFHGEEADSLGITGFLTKPFQLRQVLRLVEKALRGETDPRPTARRPAEAPSERPRQIEAPRDPVPASGDLSVRPLSDLLPALGTEAQSGRITLMAGDVVKRIVLRNGVPVFAGSSLREETLGRHLVRAEILGEPQLEALQALAAERRVKLGEVLLAEGVMDPHDLYERIREHMVEKIVRAFAWTEGRFELAVGDEHADKLTLVRMDVPELVLAGVRDHMEDAEIARHLPVDADARAFVRADAAYPPDALPLGPMAHRLLQLLGRGKTLGEIGEILGKDLEAVRRELYAFFVLRVVGIRISDGAGESQARRGATTTPRRSALSGPVPRTAPAAVQAVASLLADYLRIKGKDHFAVLEVPRSAAADEIRAAYERWRARLDPASLPSEVTGEMRDRAEELLHAISEAHAVLSDETRRVAYERSLASEAVAGVDPVLEAERDLKEARRLLRRGLATQAVEPLRRLLRRAPSEPTYAAELALALLLSDPRNHRDEIQRLATRARKGSPDLATPYFVLGKMALLDEEPARAETLLRRALVSDPDHVDAARELGLLATRK